MPKLKMLFLMSALACTPGPVCRGDVDCRGAQVCASEDGAPVSTKRCTPTCTTAADCVLAGRPRARCALLQDASLGPATAAPAIGVDPRAGAARPVRSAIRVCREPVR